MTSPITPPDELVVQWRESWRPAHGEFGIYIAVQASQWGWVQRGAATEAELQKARDEELRACEIYLAGSPYPSWAKDLRATRRPKPPSKADQALEQRGAATEAELQKAADQELNACCEVVNRWVGPWHPGIKLPDRLRAARRPKPPNEAELQKARDEELKGCEEWVAAKISVPEAAELRAARRPKATSKADIALADLDALAADLSNHGMGKWAANLRHALERLKELGAAND